MAASIAKFILLALILFSCASSTRTLSESERLKLGLPGTAFDIRVCPNIYDEKAKATRVSGNCELVDCSEKSGKAVCTARPEVKK